jgi:hypothetical protein
MSSPNNQYEEKNDTVSGDVPAGDVNDNSYVSRTGQYQIPVDNDNAPIEDPINPATADSDETLGVLMFLYHTRAHTNGIFSER